MTLCVDRVQTAKFSTREMCCKPNRYLQIIVTLRYIAGLLYLCENIMINDAFTDKSIEEIDVERNSSDSETSSCSPEQPSVVHEPEEPQYIYISSGEESITEEEDIHQQQGMCNIIYCSRSCPCILKSQVMFRYPWALN